MKNEKQLIEFLDTYLIKEGKASITPVEANEILAKAKLLSDSKDRLGLPLRKLLRAGKLPHAFQSNAKWIIPHSSKFSKK